MAVLLLGASSAVSAAGQPELHFVTKPFAPYTFAGADGQAAGPMVELLFAACARLQWRCTVQVLPWRRAWGMAQRGQVDGVFPIVDSPARRAAFQLSPAVVTGRYVLLARAASALPCQAIGQYNRQAANQPVSSLEHCNLAGRTIAAYGPSDAATTLQQLVGHTPGVHTEMELDHDTVLRKLAHGRYGHDGLAVANQAVAQHAHNGFGAGPLRQAAVLKDLAYAFAFTPRSVGADQVADFSDAIRVLCRSGQSDGIFRSHGLAGAAACR